MSVDRDRAARAVEGFLRALGHEPSSHPDLVETGRRVADAWADDLLAGEGIDAGALLVAESFDGPGDGAWVVLRDHPTHAICPHHLLPALGTATVAYVPAKRVAGLGTLARVVDAHTKRLVLQENAADAIAKDLALHLGAKRVGVRLAMRHACLAARGEKSQAVVEAYAFVGDDEGGTLRALLEAK